MGFFDAIGGALSSIGSGIMGAIDTVLSTGGDILSGVADTFGLGDFFGGATDVVESMPGTGGALDAVTGGIVDSAAQFSGYTTGFDDLLGGMGGMSGITPDVVSGGLDLTGSIGDIGTMFENLSLPSSSPALSTAGAVAQQASDSGILDSIVDFAKTDFGGKLLSTAATAGIMGGLQWMMAGEKQKAAEEARKDQQAHEESMLDKKLEAEKEQMELKKKLEEELYKAKQLGPLNVAPPQSIFNPGGVVNAPRPNAIVPQIQLNPVGR